MLLHLLLLLLVAQTALAVAFLSLLLALLLFRLTLLVLLPLVRVLSLFLNLASAASAAALRRSGQGCAGQQRRSQTSRNHIAPDLFGFHNRFSFLPRLPCGTWSDSPYLKSNWHSTAEKARNANI